MSMVLVDKDELFRKLVETVNTGIIQHVQTIPADELVEAAKNAIKMMHEVECYDPFGDKEFADEFYSVRSKLENAMRAINEASK